MQYGMEDNNMHIEISDEQFGVFLLYKLLKILYLMGGLYFCYPELLEFVFWPFHYGWFAH